MSFLDRYLLLSELEREIFVLSCARGSELLLFCTRGVHRRELEFLIFDEFGVGGGGGGGPLLLNAGGEPRRAMFSFRCNFVDFSCFC